MKYYRIKKNERIETKISLKKINIFIVNYWKSIIFITFISLILSYIYILIAPKQYEVNSEIYINSQINNVIKEENLKISLTLLKNEMNYINFYDEQTIKECNLKKNKYLLVKKNIKFSISRENSNSLQIKLRNPSLENAEKCILLIFQQIKKFSFEKVSPFINELNNQIMLEEKQLMEINNILGKISLNEYGNNDLYINLQLQTIYLNKKISTLKFQKSQLEKLEEIFLYYYEVSKYPVHHIISIE